MHVPQNIVMDLNIVMGLFELPEYVDDKILSYIKDVLFKKKSVCKWHRTMFV